MSANITNNIINIYKNYGFDEPDILNEDAILSADSFQVLEECIKYVAEEASDFKLPPGGSNGAVLVKSGDGVDWGDILTTDDFDNFYTKKQINEMFGESNNIQDLNENLNNIISSSGYPKNVISSINILDDILNNARSTIGILENNLNNYITDIYDDINRIDDDIDRIDGEIGQIKEDITNIQESQQESLQELQNEISELKKNNDNKFAELLERIEDIESNIETIIQDLSELEYNLTQDIQDIRDQINSDNGIIPRLNRLEERTGIDGLEAEIANNQNIEYQNLNDKIDCKVRELKTYVNEQINNSIGGGGGGGNGGNPSDDITNIYNELEDIKGNIDSINNNLNEIRSELEAINSDINNLKSRMDAAETNINDLNGRMTIAENNISKNTDEINDLKDRISNEEGKIELNMTNSIGIGSVAQYYKEGTNNSNNSAEGKFSAAFGTNNTIKTDFGFAIGNGCNYNEDNTAIFMIGNGSSSSLSNLVSVSTNKTLLHSGNVIIDKQATITTANITTENVKTSNIENLKIINSLIDNSGSTGAVDMVLSTDSNKKPVWKKLDVSLMSDWSVECVGRFANPDAKQQAPTSYSQGEIFNNYNGNKAPGDNSHAEGDTTYAIGAGSHSGGSNSAAIGDNCFAHGLNIVAGKTFTSGSYSYNANDTSASGRHHQQFIVGKNNTCDGSIIFAVGCGANTTSRKNSLEATSNGINVYGNIYFGKPENDNKITPETISSILSRLDIVEDLCGDANNQISKFRFDEDGNLLIDGFIKDLIGINPSTNQVLSWNGSDLEWVNCTGIDSNNFKKKVSITQRQWNLETINGAPVYCFDIPHGFTLTESSFIDAICYTDDNIRLFLSYKVNNNSVVIYSPTPINYNIHVIIKLI